MAPQGSWIRQQTRWLTIVAAVVVPAGLAAWVAVATSGPSYSLAPATKGSVQETDSAASTVESANDATESFDESGTVGEVDSYAGEEVYAGEDLASLDTSSIDDAIVGPELLANESTPATDESGQVVQDQDAFDTAQQQLNTDQTALGSDQRALRIAESDYQSSLDQLQGVVAEDQQRVTGDMTVLGNDQSALTKDEAALQSTESAFSAAGCPTPPSSSTADSSRLPGNGLLRRLPQRC